ncbi:hypothetical protein EYR36_003308 [Pleurotus pulmonarius]|nr:hypothetical protein EYR36_003308 [Pleurotus pulmonarius]
MILSFNCGKWQHKLSGLLHGEHEHEVSSDHSSDLIATRPDVDNENGVIELDHLKPDETPAAHNEFLVQKLTTSNNDVFECLQVFYKRYSKFTWPILHGEQKKIHKHVVEQAGIYGATIDISITVARKGIEISKAAHILLEDTEVDAEFMVTPMMKNVEEASQDVAHIADRFRKIRTALFDVKKEISPNASFQRVEKAPWAIDIDSQDKIKRLEEMADKDLLLFTLAVVERFVNVVGYFIDWWRDNLGVDVNLLKSTINCFRMNPAMSQTVQKQWETLEKEYCCYTSKISSQQDYYHQVLEHMKPESFARKYLGIGKG